MRRFPVLLFSLLAAALVLTGCAGPLPAPARAGPVAKATAKTDAAPAPASAPAAEPLPAISPTDREIDAMVTSAQSSARSTAEWMARSVDSWFGDRPFEDGGSVKDGRLHVRLSKRQRESVDLDVRFNARFRLPNAERFGYFFIGRDDPRDLVTDRPGALSNAQRLSNSSNNERSFFAGIGREVNDAVDFRLGLRGGLKLYAQARYKHPWQLGPDDLAEFRQTVFWTHNDRLGSTSALSYEHAFAPDLVGRWLSAATITQDSRRFEWQSSLGAYLSLGRKRLLELEAQVFGREGSGVGLTDYGLQLRWEQPVHRETLLGEILIGRFWPRADLNMQRRGAWAAGLGLKLRF